MESEVILKFAVKDPYRCHTYSITEDTKCELEQGEMIESFKIHVALNTGDISFLRVESSRSNATVYINDTDEPECSKLSPFCSDTIRYCETLQWAAQLF